MPVSPDSRACKTEGCVTKKNLILLYIFFSLEGWARGGIFNFSDLFLISFPLKKKRKKRIAPNISKDSLQMTSKTLGGAFLKYVKICLINFGIINSLCELRKIYFKKNVIDFILQNIHKPKKGLIFDFLQSFF